ncbi:hypothetical protein TRVA0_011S02564 [Trichomonascus vanleenenianus]|uniref:uncharacterized protein n=1 Tax=Trichomonascus vanleenenianus TaxID=2268995 RepID=UPI003EC98376
MSPFSLEEAFTTDPCSMERDILALENDSIQSATHPTAAAAESPPRGFHLPWWTGHWSSSNVESGMKNSAKSSMQPHQSSVTSAIPGIGAGMMGPEEAQGDNKERRRSSVDVIREELGSKPGINRVVDDSLKGGMKPDELNKMMLDENMKSHELRCMSCGGRGHSGAYCPNRAGGNAHKN